MGTDGGDLRADGLPLIHSPRVVLSGAKKTPPCSATEQQLADVDAVFSALANASRRHILLVLHYRGGEMTAGDIAGRFACSWPTTSRHLKILLEAGLVAAHREGRERVYLLQANRIAEVAGNWVGLFDREARVRPARGLPSHA